MLIKIRYPNYFSELISFVFCLWIINDFEIFILLPLHVYTQSVCLSSFSLSLSFLSLSLSLSFLFLSILSISPVPFSFSLSFLFLALQLLVKKTQSNSLLAHFCVPYEGSF